LRLPRDRGCRIPARAVVSWLLEDGPFEDWRGSVRAFGMNKFRAPATDRSTAVATACILIRHGHDVIKLGAISGETIETDEIRRLCDK